MHVASVVLQVVTAACVANAGLQNCGNCDICEGYSIRRNIRQYNEGRVGFDVWTAVSKKQFSCLRCCAFEFVVIRAYEDVQNGQVDANGVSSIENAGAAGFPSGDVHVYMSPAVGLNAKSANEQVAELAAALQGKNYSRIWIQVEGIWNGNVQEHQDVFTQLLSQIEAQLHKPAGVYTSEAQWNQTMGRTFFGGSNLPLWCVKHEHPPSPASVRTTCSFGNWTSFFIKQFRENSNCNVDLNENWVD